MTTIIRPIRTVMVSTQWCLFCRKNSETTKIYDLEDLNGWIACDNCIPSLNESIKDYIVNSNVIPMFWYFNEKNPDGSIYFYRERTGQIIKARIRPALFYNGIHKKFFIRVYWDENDNMYEKNVDFKNILQFNPTIYNNLINCPNLFKRSWHNVDCGGIPESVKKLLDTCLE